MHVEEINAAVCLCIDWITATVVVVVAVAWPHLGTVNSQWRSFAQAHLRA